MAHSVSGVKLAISCPSCSTLNQVSMTVKEPSSLLDGLMKQMMPEADTYVFMGNDICSHCGKAVVATLQVTSEPLE